MKAALQKLENGGAVDDAKAVCESEVLRQLTRWHVCGYSAFDISLNNDLP